MPVDVQNFQVDEVVVHDVPKRSDLSADDAITFSEAPIPNIDPQRRNFFRERIAISLASGKEHHVVRDPDQSSDVPQLVAFILERPEDLVEASQDFARALYASQNRVNNPPMGRVSWPPSRWEMAAGDTFVRLGAGPVGMNRRRPGRW